MTANSTHHPTTRRRALLRLAAVAGGAAILTHRTREADASTGFMKFGTANNAGTDATSLTSSKGFGAQVATFNVGNTAQLGAAIAAEAATYGVYATATNVAGVLGRGPVGVEGLATTNTGIGVRGNAFGDGVAVSAVANVSGIGVAAFHGGSPGGLPPAAMIASADGSFGLLASAAGGTAIDARSGEFSGAAEPLPGVGIRASGTKTGILAQGDAIGATALRAEAPAGGKAVAAVGNVDIVGDLAVSGKLPATVARRDEPNDLAKPLILRRRLRALGPVTTRAAGVKTLRAGKKTALVVLPASVTLGGRAAIILSPMGNPKGRQLYAARITATKFRITASDSDSTALKIAWLAVN